MRKLALAVLVVAAFAAGIWAWRAATEANRRYSEILELVRANAGKSGSGWSERDADRFWENVEWFRQGDGARLGRQLVASIRDGPESEEAAAVAAGLIDYRHYRDNPLKPPEGRILPPPPSASKGFYDTTPFRIDLVLEDDRAVDRLAELPSPSVRRLLLQLLGLHPKSSPHAWELAARLAEKDPDLELRLFAIYTVAHWAPRQRNGELLDRLAGSSDPDIRLGALASLAQRGDAQRGRDFVVALMQAPDAESRRRGARSTMIVPDSLSTDSILALELWSFILEGDVGMNGQGWELAERLGSVLERRAVGEYDEPQVEK